MADGEVSVGAEGITLKGGVVEDVRPLVRRAVKTSDAILRLIDNVVGLPVDYVSNNLERFRSKYAHRFEEIPLEHRQEPPMRIGCAVLKHVAYSADEPDIQELFANLLAAASNTEMAKHVHPGFATVISEMRGVDAVVLRSVSNGRIPASVGARAPDIEPDEYAQALSNLVRLGLLGWRATPYGQTELKKLAPKSYGSFIRPEQGMKLLIDLVNDVQRLKGELINQLGEQHRRIELEVTSFGRHFIAAVTEPLPTKMQDGATSP